MLKLKKSIANTKNILKFTAKLTVAEFKESVIAINKSLKDVKVALVNCNATITQLAVNEGVYIWFKTTVKASGLSAALYLSSTAVADLSLAVGDFVSKMGSEAETTRKLNLSIHAESIRLSGVANALKVNWL